MRKLKAKPFSFLAKWRLGKWRVGFYLRFFCRRTETVTGVTSFCFDGWDSHILLWDFEQGATLQDVLYALNHVRRLWELGEIHVFSNSHSESYRAICCNKVTLETMQRILMMTPFICMNYMKGVLARGCASLRLSQKGNNYNIYLGTIGEHSWRVYSYPHSRLLQVLYNIPVPYHHDGNKRFQLVRYETVIAEKW